MHKGVITDERMDNDDGGHLWMIDAAHDIDWWMPSLSRIMGVQGKRSYLVDLRGRAP